MCLSSPRIHARRRVYLYLLLEHQSTVEPDMLLRLHEYIIRICKYLRRKGLRGRLPLIIPMVVAHAPGGWTSPQCYDDMFNPDPITIPGLAEFVPRCKLLLEDLSATSNEELEAKALTAFPTLALWLLRDARDGRTLFANLSEWAAVFHEAIVTPNGVEAVALLLRYIALVCDDRYEEFRENLSKQLPEAEQAVMTIAEELRQEGRQEGRQEERHQVLERMLVLKFQEVPPEHLARIRAVTDDERDGYIERILTAETLAEVFEERSPGDH
jgi:hypothetical protein